jgi:inosine-uridine nucleoside N-ribohydrolase
LLRQFRSWFRHLVGLHLTGRGTQIGDALTIGAVIDPSLMKIRRCFVDVETRGELSIGQTVAYGLSIRHPAPKEPNTDLTVDCYWKRFNELFLERVIL